MEVNNIYRKYKEEKQETVIHGGRKMGRNNRSLSLSNNKKMEESVDKKRAKTMLNLSIICPIKELHDSPAHSKENKLK